MKKILALILLIVLTFFSYLYLVNYNIVQPYGESKLNNSVSEKYVNQSVTASSENITYGRTKNAELGAANAVTNVVLGYRAFDTLGEVSVLFVSALGVSLLIGSTGFISREKSGFILRVGSKVVLPIILIVGVFVITHGHLTPGGGFQGGAMIAAAMLLMALSDPEFFPVVRNFKILEGLSGTAFIIIGLIGIQATGYFLSNYMSTGMIGDLISAGTLPILYVFIGLKVGSELTNIIADFVGKEAKLD